MTCTYAHMQLRSPVQDITHTNTHAFKKKTGEKPTHSTKQLTEVMTLRGPQGKGRQHCTVPHPLFTDTVPRTEKAALDQKRASEIASQQVCRETSASSSASSAALTPAPLPRKKGVRDAITRRSGLKNYERSVHRVQSRSTQSSMHSLAHVYRLLPQPVSKASTPSAHLRNGSVQRAAPRTCGGHCAVQETSSCSSTATSTAARVKPPTRRPAQCWSPRVQPAAVLRATVGACSLA